MKHGGIRVLVVDDSPVVRQVLVDQLSADPSIAEVHTSPDGHLALRKIAKLDPDVVTLDIEMPQLDGLTTLREIMSQFPRPVIMLSSMSTKTAGRTVHALELGAADFILKPGGRFSDSAVEVCTDLINRIKAVATSPKLQRKRHNRAEKPSQAAPAQKHPERLIRTDKNRTLVAIGASTGGTEAILRVISQLSAPFPAGIVVVQHMPEGFTKSFAQRLDELCSLDVKEAEHRDMIRSNRVLLAPGNSHMVVCSGDHGSYVELNRKPRVNRHRPSVDVLFDSISRSYGARAIAVLLTGMGRDGASGMSRLREYGALTIAQNAASCVVYGMPKAAIDEGSAQVIADLNDIPNLLARAVTETTTRSRAQRNNPETKSQGRIA